MHQVIYALVEASSADEALVNGKAAFDRLVGTGPEEAVFDYYVTFDDQSSVAGKARWGELPVVAPIDSEAGTNLLNRGWTATKQEFEQNLDRMKKALNEYSDEEIMRNEDLTRHAFHQVGAYDGPSVFLYDENATSIRHRDQLNRLLNESAELWVVPADVHY